MSPPRTGGGAGTQAGMDYQNRVAAWVAVRILAEQDASPPWDLSSNVTIEFLRCETEQTVDDLLVGTSSKGHGFFQVKHTLNLETSVGSDLASSLDQFIRQLIAYRHTTKGQRPWERSLDVERDRLILVTGPGSSAPIRQTLPAILERLRSLAPGQAIDDAATNKQEGRTLDVMRNHVTRLWRNAMGADPTDDDLRSLFCLLRVQTLDIDAGRSNEREAKDLLRSSVLRDPTQANATWDILVQACAGYASTRSGADRAILQSVLLQAGITLKAQQSYRDDIERLRALSRSTVGAVSDLSKILIGSAELKISRQSTLALRDAAEAGSLVVVGEPGAGKSGALHDLVEILHHEARDVIFFAVDRLEASSLGTLRNEIGLAHNLDEVLKNWPGAEPGFLIIDALDAARSEASARTFRDLISIALKLEGRWRVIASIRKFDLRYSPQLQQLFSGQPPMEFCDNEFADLCHLNVPLLSDDELEQIPPQSRDVAELIRRADPSLCDVLRVPFNLRLMGDLIGSGVAIESLTPIRTQTELLDRYWQERIIRSDPQGDAREAVLRRAAEKMVETRSLHVNRTDVSSDPATSPALRDVLSSHVLTEWQPSPETTDRYVLTFAHHVLFDYAVARLLLRGVPESIIERLEGDPELVLAIRPSLVLHFQYLWSRDLTCAFFWELTLQVIRARSIPEVGKLIGPSVAAEQMTQLSDCEPLLSALEDADPTICEAAEQALRHVVGTIVAAPPNPTRPLVGVGAGPWCELLERSSQSMRLPVAYTVRLLLITLSERPDEFTPAQRDLAGMAARRLEVLPIVKTIFRVNEVSFKALN